MFVFLKKEKRHQFHWVQKNGQRVIFTFKEVAHLNYIYYYVHQTEKKNTGIARWAKVEKAELLSLLYDVLCGLTSAWQNTDYL